MFEPAPESFDGCAGNPLDFLHHGRHAGPDSTGFMKNLKKGIDFLKFSVKIGREHRIFLNCPYWGRFLRKAE